MDQEKAKEIIQKIIDALNELKVALTPEAPAEPAAPAEPEAPAEPAPPAEG